MSEELAKCRTQLWVLWGLVAVVAISGLISIVVLLLMPSEDDSAAMKTKVALCIEVPSDPLSAIDFHPAWHHPPFSMMVAAPSRVTPEEAVALVRDSLGIFAEETLARHLDCVVIVGRLRFYGYLAGGINLGRTAVVSVEDEVGRYTADKVQRATIHEVVAVLLRENDHHFPHEAWTAELSGLPRGMGYTDRSEVADSRFKSLFLSEYWAHYGFVSQYGSTSFEDDVCTIAERVLTGDSEFWELSDRHPTLGRKRDLVIQFLGTLDRKIRSMDLRSRVRQGSGT